MLKVVALATTFTFVGGPMAAAQSAASAPDAGQPPPPPAAQSGDAENTQSATKVHEVTVTAERPAVQAKIDRKVYNVSKDLQSTTGSAADVLNEVPSVGVDVDGNVTLRGDPNVTILIDGKPSAQFSGPAQGASLLQLPASDIDHIEVMTSPPAEYRAEGAGGVINIVTKKHRKQGLSGSAQASLGNDRRYLLGLNGAYNVGPLSLSGGVTMRQDAKTRLSDTWRTAVDPTSQALAASRQSIDEQFHRRVPQVTFGLGYKFDDSRSVELAFSHRELTGHRYFDQHDESGAPSEAPTSVSDRHSDGKEWNLAGSEAVRFEQKLWRPGETLSLQLQRSVEREREKYAYVNDYALPAAPPSYDDLHLSHDLVTTELSLDYVLPMSGERSLKFGYDLEAQRNAFDNRGDDIEAGLPVNNPNITNDFRYRQTVQALYGEYEAPIGRWTVQGGIRLEQTDVHTLQVIGDLAGGANYFRAYPSLHLIRSLSETTKMSLGVSRRVTRPDPEALDPFTDYQDTHNLRAGNANLLPQDTWSYELGYSASGQRISWGVNGYYRFIRDSVTDVVKVVSADVVLATKENLPQSRAAGMEFNVNGKLFSKLSYGLSGNLFHNQIDATALGFPGLRSTTGVNLKADLDWRPTSADTAQIAFSRSDRRLTPQGYVGAINLVNLGYRRQLRPDLAAVATITDAFDGQRYQRILSTPALRDDYLRHQLGRVAYLGVVYTFGAQKKAKGSGFEYDQ